MRVSGVATGSVLLVLAATVVTPGTASGQTNTAVPCSGSGGGSDGLIAAINAANSGGGGTITLASSCTYSLTASNNGTNGSPMSGASGENGLPVITSTIQIVGSSTTIMANNTTFRILMVAGGGNLTLQGLTLSGGNSPFGGAIANLESTLTLDNTVVTGNTAAMGGGGIASGILNPNHTGPLGSLTLNNSEVTGNTVKGGGAEMAGGGGGILNHQGSLTLNGSQVSSNTSGGGGGGIASGAGGGDASGSRLTLNNSQVDNNVSNGGPMAGAGGIANGGTATITGSQVNGNRAPGASGGGILNHGTMTIESSQVDNNSAPIDSSGNPGFGGGIANINLGPATGGPNGGQLTIDRTQIQGNSALIGPAIIEEGINSSGSPDLAGGPLTIEASQIAGNTGFAGGGINANLGSQMTFANNTFGSNPTTGCSGRSGNDAWLCAVYLDVLGRPMDSTGAAHFEGLLAHGASRAQVADQILTSTEYWKGFVNYIYENLLSRPVEPIARSMWVARLSSGMSDATFISEVAGSQEFYKNAGSTNAGYVSALYNLLLGRSPSQSDASFWTAKLSSGTSRTSVAAGIVTSKELARSALQTVYLSLLDRPASSTDISNWYSVLLRGVSFEEVQAQIAGSPECYAKHH